MPFITQGSEGDQAPYRARKTNWKYIIIVVILAIIVGAGALWCLLKQEPPFQSPKGGKPQTSKEFTLNLDEEVRVVYEFNIGTSLRKEEFILSLDSIDMSQAKVKFSKHCFPGSSDMVIEDRQVCLVTEEGGAWFKLISIEPDKAKFEVYFSVGPPHPLGPFAPKEIIITKNETADWKTYRNEEYGFEIKYPQDFIEQKIESDEGLLNIKKDDDHYLVIGVIKKYNIDQIISTIKDAKEVSIGSHLGYEYFYTEGAGASEVLLIQVSQDVLSISLDYINDKTFSNANDKKTYVQNIFNQMLSTFKFIDKFCGSSTYGSCASDSDCIAGGCSGQLCQSKNDELLGTTCEWKECYRAQDYGLDCKCVDQKCQWAK